MGVCVLVPTRAACINIIYKLFETFNRVSVLRGVHTVHSGLGCWSCFFFLWYMFLTRAPFFVPPDGKCSFVLTLVTLSRHHSRHQLPVAWVTSVQPNSSINASSPRQKKMGNRGGLGIFTNVLGRSGPERVLPTPNTITVSYQCQ